MRCGSLGIAKATCLRASLLRHPRRRLLRRAPLPPPLVSRRAPALQMTATMTPTVDGTMCRDVANAMTTAVGLATRVRGEIRRRRPHMGRHTGAADSPAARQQRLPEVPMRAGLGRGAPERERPLPRLRPRRYNDR